MISVLLVSFCLLFATVSSAKYQPTWNSLDTRPLPQWYDQVKFGIFMHWGVYSVPSFGPGFSAEWFWYRWQNKEPGYAEFIEKNYPPGFTYPDFAPMFKAEMFDPVKWANLFKQSGAKYVVLTSKHHEGFTNWPSKTAWNWNAVDTGPHMDLVGSLADAIRNTTDIHFGLYFSQFEWFNPLYLNDAANNFTTTSYPQQVSIPQMYEIVNAYKPEVIWSDGDGRAPYSYWNSTEFLAWLYNESPVKDTIVVNDRWGSECHCTHGGFFTCHDRYNPYTLQKYKWENAFTVDSHSWGYRRDATISDILSIEEILKQIVSTVSCGGNALMNVGPTHDGRIVPIFEERLLQIGAWLKTNGEAIYNTIPWKHQNDSVNGDVWYTLGNGDDSKGNVYAINLKWPDNNQLNLGSVKVTSTSKATLLGYGSVQMKGSTNGQTQIMMPGLSLDTQLLWAWVIKLEGVAPN
jgi:alpha-L-fucosidase